VAWYIGRLWTFSGRPTCRYGSRRLRSS